MAAVLFTEQKAAINVGNPRILYLELTTPGFPKSTVGDFMQIFFHEPAGGFMIEPEVMKGGDESELAVGGGAHKVTWVYKSDAADMLILQNICNWCKGAGTAMADLAGLVHVFAKNENSEFFNFFSNPNLQDWIGTPGCSTAMSLHGTKFIINKTTRYVEWHLNGWMTDAQFQYLNSQKAAYTTVANAAPAGLASGVTNVIGAVTSSRALRVLPHGIHTQLWTPGGGAQADMGVLEDASFEGEIVGNELQFNRQRNLQLRITQTAKTFQASLAQMTAGASATITDGTLVQKTVAGETINFVNARPIFKSHGLANDQSYVEMKATSLISLSTGVDFTSVNAPVFTANNV